MPDVIRIKYKNGDYSKKFYSNFENLQGVKVRRALSQFKDEARTMQRDLIQSMRGIRGGDRMSWAAFRIKYLEHSKANKDHNTYYKDKRAFDLVEAYGDPTHLNDMTPEFLEGLRMEWVKHIHPKKGHKWNDNRKIGFSTIGRSVRAIKTAMRWAEDYKYVGPQNWRIVKADEPDGRHNYFTIDQFKRLLEECDPAWTMCAMLQGRGGLRFGEAYNLEWTDIQWEKRRLKIHSRPGVWHIKGDQKGTAVKFVPLEISLYQYLKDRRKPNGFVVNVDGYCKADGGRMTENWFLNKFRTFLKRAGLRTDDNKAKPHDLRHSAASWMINTGSTLDEVGAVLGHKPGSKSTAIYTHIYEETKHAAVNRMPPL